MYLGYRNGQYLNANMEHLTCFAGGLLALAVQTGVRGIDREATLEAAKGITETCYLMYHKQKRGLSPEKVSMHNMHAADGNSAYYIQRPEAIESLFYLWRITKDEKYREWGWEIAQSINKHCRVENGFSGLNNIDRDPTDLNDNQESFFLAETLKYLYLLFADDSVVPLDKYVFNTEAHPIPIQRNRK